MSIFGRGRRRTTKYRVGPLVPLIWKLTGLGVLALAAGLMSFYALNA